MQLLNECRRRENLLMIIAFLISWVPFGWVYSIPLLGIHRNDERTTVTSDALPLLTVKFGCAIINPLVYGYENSEVNIIEKCYKTLSKSFISGLTNIYLINKTNKIIVLPKRRIKRQKRDNIKYNYFSQQKNYNLKK